MYRPYLLLALVAFFSCSLTYTKTSLSVGSPAPEFSLPDELGKMHTLSLIRNSGKKVALVFYPKDGSPHCKKELCSIRDDYKELAAHNIVVLGVSYDSMEDHHTFKMKHSLPFPLLSDKNKVVTKLYSAQGPWYTFGFAPQRITFLIDEAGIIVGVIRNVDVNQHAQQIFNGFQAAH